MQTLKYLYVSILWGYAPKKGIPPTMLGRPWYLCGASFWEHAYIPVLMITSTALQHTTSHMEFTIISLLLMFHGFRVGHFVSVGFRLNCWLF
jgi:hypothetical protein